MSLLRKLSYCDEFFKQKTSKKSSGISSSDSGIGGKEVTLKARTLSQNELDDWRREKSIELTMLREWLNKQPHLPQNVTDEQLLVFLHSCWNSVEKTKQKIDHFFTMRTHSPEIFTSRSLTSEEVVQALRVARISPLRIPAINCNAIFVDCVDPEVENYNFTSVLKATGMAIDALTRYFPREENNIIVFDMRNSALAHVLKTNLVTLKKGMLFVQSALPFRVAEIHIINAFPLINQIQAMLKPFIDSELSKLIRIHMQGNMETFYKFVPQKSLPRDYGGEESSLGELNEILKEMIRAEEGYLEAVEKQVVDEKRRAGKAKSSGDVFGVEGSFRRLDFD